MRKKTFVWGSFLTFLFGIFLSIPAPEAAPKAAFSIVYMNDVMGEVEPCG